MSEPETDLAQVLKKHGRAAVAAQAAAEACLEAVRELESRLPPTSSGEEELIRALLPFADALDRVAAEARRLLGAETSLLARLAPGSGRREAVALARAVTILASQLESVLSTRGVAIDRAGGGAVDGERHRVVEVRAGKPAGVVLEVLRAGYTYRGKRLREAEVIAGKGGNP